VTSDVDAIINYSNVAAVTVTVPIATTFVAPVGTVITLISTGAGGVTVNRSGSDTINGGTTGVAVATTTAKRLMKVSETSGVSAWLLY
jgi:hypothetical protein